MRGLFERRASGDPVHRNEGGNEGRRMLLEDLLPSLGDIIERNPTARLRKASIASKVSQHDRVPSKDEIRAEHRQMPSTTLDFDACPAVGTRAGNIPRMSISQISNGLMSPAI